MIISDRSEKKAYADAFPSSPTNQANQRPHRRPDRYAINTTRAERIFYSYGNERFATERSQKPVAL